MTPVLTCGCAGVLYYVSSTANPILYNVMSHRFRRAFCDTLFRCSARRRQSTSSHRTVNVAAGTSSFALSSAAASLRQDRLCTRLNDNSQSAITTTRTLSDDDTLTHADLVDTKQLAVAGYKRRRSTVASQHDDQLTVLRYEDVAETSGSIGDAVVVRAILERRHHQNVPSHRRDPTIAASITGNMDCDE